MWGFWGWPGSQRAAPFSILPRPASPLTWVRTLDPRATPREQAARLCQAAGRAGATSFRKGASAPERPQHGLRAGHLSSDASDVSSNLWADPSGGKQAPGQTPLAPAGRLAKLHKLRGKRAPSEVLTLLTEVEGCRARPGRAAGVRRGRYQV